METPENSLSPEYQETQDLNIDYQTFVVLVGKIRSGKSHMLRNIIYTETLKKNYFKFGLCFCKTLFNKEYDFLPDKAKIEGFNEEKLYSYTEKLKAHFQKTGEKPPPSFVIFDDLLGELPIRDPKFKNWCVTVRHLNVSVFICAQYLVDNCSTLLRELTGVAIMFRTRTRNSIDMFYDCFGGSLVGSKEEFRNYFLKATDEKYSAVIYYAGSEHDDPDNNHFTVMAPDKVPNYKLKF